MSARLDMVKQLAPPAPPCFASRMEWIEYLTSSAAAQSERGQPMPLIFEAGKPVRFNYAFDYCTDCSFSASSIAALQAQGKCKPSHLLSLADLCSIAASELDAPLPAQDNPATVTTIVRRIVSASECSPPENVGPRSVWDLARKGNES